MQAWAFLWFLRLRRYKHSNPLEVRYDAVCFKTCRHVRFVASYRSSPLQKQAIEFRIYCVRNARLSFLVVHIFLQEMHTHAKMSAKCPAIYLDAQK